MARARNIKPGTFKNEILGVADPIYTLLFEGLWLLADREGRLEDRPVRIKGELFPYRDGLDMDTMLGWLQSNGFIQRYRSKGLALIQIIAFAKHQNPHKNEPESIYAGPDEIGTTPAIIGSAPADPGFLTPDSGLLIPDVPHSGGAAAPPPLQPAAPVPPPAAEPKAKRKSKTDMPDGFCVSDRVKAWAAKKGFLQLELHLEAFKRKVAANGYRYIDWDDAFMEAVREDWAKIRGRAQNGAAPPAEGGARNDPESRAAIEAEGIAKGFGPWVETEQFSVYRARVRGDPPRQLSLGDLQRLASERAGAPA